MGPMELPYVLELYVHVKEIIWFLVADVVKMQVNKDASKHMHMCMLPGYCGEDFQDRPVKEREVLFAQDSEEYIACMVDQMEIN